MVDPSLRCSTTAVCVCVCVCGGGGGGGGGGGMYICWTMCICTY